MQINVFIIQVTSSQPQVKDHGKRERKSAKAK
jgi:hypothetical protein